MVVRTAIVQDTELLAELRREHPGYEQFLEHVRLEAISYPYEWSVSMLGDAGRLTLELQIALLEDGFSLKDGTAYNVQFRAAKPIFIDVPSIERPPRVDVWFALGQFHRMFTFPLLLVRHKGWDLRSYFLGAFDGRSEREMLSAWGWLERWRPSLLIDVTLPGLLSDRDTAIGKSASYTQRTGSAGQVANLKRLRRKLDQLVKGYRVSGTWANYRPSDSYQDSSQGEKYALVDAFLAGVRPKCVLDIGCNTGEYSYLAATHGAAVVAIDADHDAIEVLYRRLQSSRANITPLVMDITNPSPGQGIGYAERSPFHDRVQPDCTLALALVHHLLGGGLRLAAIRDLLWDLTSDHMVLEAVPQEDHMFQRLMSGRRELPESITLDRMRAIFGERFQIVREAPIGESGRTLMFLRRS
jgi:SAM-dependent methyltransferase